MEKYEYCCDCQNGNYWVAVPSLFTFTEWFAVHLPQHLLTGLTSFSETRTLLKENKGDLICKSWQASDEVWFHICLLLPSKGPYAVCTHMQGAQEKLWPARVGCWLKSSRGPGLRIAYTVSCVTWFWISSTRELRYLQQQETAHQSPWRGCLSRLG